MMHVRERSGVLALNLCCQFLLVLLAGLLFFGGWKSIFLIQIIFACSLVAVVHYLLTRVTFPSFCHWFILAYVPMFMIYPITLPLFGHDFPTTDDVLLSYTFLTLVGIHSFLLSYEFFSSRSSASRTLFQSLRVDQFSFSVAIWTLFALMCLSFLLRASEIGSLGQAVTASRNEIKEGANIASVLGGYILNFAVILFALLPAYLSKARWSIPIIVPALFILDVLLFLYSRGRAWLIMHMVSVIVGWLFLKAHIHVLASRQRRQEYQIFSRRFFKFLAIFACIAFFGIYLRVARTYISPEADISQLRVYDTIEHAFVYGEFGFAPTVFEVLEVFPSQEPFLGGQSYYRLFFVPIPRSVWPEKPESTARLLGDILRPDGHDAQTNTAGVMGDLYINFGFWGVFGMLLYGAIFAFADKRRDMVSQLVLCCAFVPVFNIVRGAFTGPILVLTVITLSSVIFVRFVRRRTRKAQRKIYPRPTSSAQSVLPRQALPGGN